MAVNFYPTGDWSVLNYNGNYFLTDNKNKKLIRFSNNLGLNAYLNSIGWTPEDLEANATQVDDETFNDLSKTWRINNNQYITPDGSLYTNNSSIDLNALTNRYGQSANPQRAMEMANVLFGQNGFFQKMLAAAKSGDTSMTGDMSAQQIQNIISDPNAKYRYIAAATYGGYSLADIYRDMKWQTLPTEIKTGVPKPIDEADNRSVWNQANQGYVNIEGSPLLSLPTNLSNIAGTDDETMLSTPLFNLPKSFFTGLTDIGQDYIKNMARNIKATYYDLQAEIINAQDEQSLALAQSKYSDFKKNIEKQLGFALSDNADTAWEQIQNIEQSFTNKGIGQSGIAREALSTYLNKIRQSDERNRESAAKQTSDAYESYLLTSGTPEEIQQFYQKNPERAKELGLIRSSEEANRILSEIENDKTLEQWQKDAYKQMLGTQVTDANGNTVWINPSTRTAATQDKEYTNQANKWQTQINKAYSTVDQAEQDLYKDYQTDTIGYGKDETSQTKDVAPFSNEDAYKTSTTNTSNQVDDVAPFSNEDAYKVSSTINTSQNNIKKSAEDSYNNTYNTNPVSQAFSKYGYTAAQTDIDWWSKNQKNQWGTLEQNLQRRKQQDQLKVK